MARPEKQAAQIMQDTTSHTGPSAGKADPRGTARVQEQAKQGNQETQAGRAPGSEVHRTPGVIKKVSQGQSDFSTCTRFEVVQNFCHRKPPPPPSPLAARTYLHARRFIHKQTY